MKQPEVSSSGGARQEYKENQSNSKKPLTPALLWLVWFMRKAEGYFFDLEELNFNKSLMFVSLGLWN